jgi:hypothetical protein
MIFHFLHDHFTTITQKSLIIVRKFIKNPTNINSCIFPIYMLPFHRP